MHLCRSPRPGDIDISIIWSFSPPAWCGTGSAKRLVPLLRCSGYGIQGDIAGNQSPCEARPSRKVVKSSFRNSEAPNASVQNQVQRKQNSSNLQFPRLKRPWHGGPYLFSDMPIFFGGLTNHAISLVCFHSCSILGSGPPEGHARTSYGLCIPSKPPPLRSHFIAVAGCMWVGPLFMDFYR